MPVFTQALLLKGGCRITAGTKADTLTALLLTEVFGASVELTKVDERYILRITSKSSRVM